MSPSFHPGFTAIPTSPGFGARAAQRLADDDAVVGVGLDGPSLDQGTNHNMEAHRALFAKNKFGMENMADLKDVPAVGST